MKILTKLSNFLTKNKKNIIFLVFFIGFFLILTDVSFAQEAQQKPSDKDKIVDGLNEIIKWSVILMGLLTQMIGYFLSPGWTTGSDLGLGEKLKTLWIFVSNVVYFIFAGLFIFIALMNIIGREGETYQLKQAIPRFIVGILIVPFTWFFVQFVISISAILTAAILSLPINTFGDFKEDMAKIEICSHMEIIEQKGENGKKGLITFKCKDESKKINLRDLLSDSKNMYSILNIYTYGIFSIDKSGLFSNQELEPITDIPQLISKLGFSLVMFIVYIILLAALFLALATRGIYLWIITILSPVFGLLYFFKKTDGAGEGRLKNISVKQFISLALVPVYVSAALAFGLTFIYVAGKSIPNNGGKVPEAQKYFNIKEENGKFTTSVGYGGNIMKLTTDKPIVGTYGEEKNSFKKVVQGFQGSLGTLIAQLFGIVILWIGVVAALKSSDITKEVVEPIAQFGNSIGSLVAKAPTYVPILPGGLSAQGLSRIGSERKTYYENKAINTGNEFMKRHNLFQSKDTQLSTRVDDALRRLNNSASLNESLFKEFTSTMKEFENVAHISNIPKRREYIIAFGKKVGVEERFLKANNPQEVAQLLQQIHERSIKNINYDGGLVGTKESVSDTSVDFWNKYLKGGSSDSGGRSGSTLSPLVQIKLESKDSSGVKIKVDGDTIINVKSDGNIDQTDLNNLVEHLVNENTIGTMTEEELRKWLKDKLGLSDTAIENVIREVKAKISTLKKDGKPVGDDFWKK